MTLVDAYGRDLAWLRANRPRRAPTRWARFCNVFWPSPAVELYDAWQRMEREQARLDADLIDALLKKAAAR